LYAAVAVGKKKRLEKRQHWAAKKSTLHCTLGHYRVILVFKALVISEIISQSQKKTTNLHSLYA